MVAQSLFPAQAGCLNVMHADPPSLGLIYGPLHDFVGTQHWDLIGTLKRPKIRAGGGDRLDTGFWYDYGILRQYHGDVPSRAGGLPHQYSAYFVLRTSLTETPTCSICTDNRIDDTKRHRRVSPSTAVQAHFLPLLPRRVFLYHLAQLAETSLRNYATGGISTVHALYSKLYEKLASMSPNCHSSSSSSNRIGTMRFTGKNLDSQKGLPFLFPHISQLKMYQQQAVSEMRVRVHGKVGTGRGY